MSALLLPSEPDDRTSLTAVPDTGTSPDRHRPRKAVGPAAPGRAVPTVRRTAPAGPPRPRTALTGPERRSWDPLRFQPALASDAVAEEEPVAGHRRARPGRDTTRAGSAWASARTAGAPRAQGRPVPPAPAVARAGLRAPSPAVTAAPRREAGTLVCAAAEALLGLRPAEQLARWTTPELFDALVRRAGLARRILGSGPRTHPVVRSVHLEATASGACEAAVMLHDGERTRAAAARLVVRRGRWVLDRLEIA